MSIEIIELRRNIERRDGNGVPFLAVEAIYRAPWGTGLLVAREDEYASPYFIEGEGDKWLLRQIRQFGCSADC